MLETQRLLESGQHADGRDSRETQMILNHKHAIQYLVDVVEDGGGLDRAAILNLHGILADNLLPDPRRSRAIAVAAGWASGGRPTGRRTYRT